MKTGLERVGRFMTFVRLVLQPEAHPWDRDRRGWWRSAAMFAGALFVLFLILSFGTGCTYSEHAYRKKRRAQEIRAETEIKAPKDGPICSTVFADLSAELPDEEEEEDRPRPERAVYEVALPPAAGMATVTVSAISPLPEAAKVRFLAAGINQTQEVGRSFELDLSRVSSAITFELELDAQTRDACGRACRLRFEAQGAFGAPAALQNLVAAASGAMSQLEKGFLEQNAGASMSVREATGRARRMLVLTPCSAPEVEEAAAS